MSSYIINETCISGPCKGLETLQLPPNPLIYVAIIILVSIVIGYLVLLFRYNKKGDDN